MSAPAPSITVFKGDTTRFKNVVDILETDREAQEPDALRDFVPDRLAGRPEVGHVETRVVYEHAQRPVLEPLE